MLQWQALYYPPYPDATVTTVFGFRSTHIYTEILYFGIISGKCSTKRLKTNEQVRFLQTI